HAEVLEAFLTFFSNLLILTLAGERCDLLKWRLPYIENGYIERSAFMKFASIKPDEIAVVKNDTLVPVGRILARHGALPQNFSMRGMSERSATKQSPGRTAPPPAGPPTP